MNIIGHIRHLAGILAASALLAFAMASPAMAMTTRLPYPGANAALTQVPAQIHTVVVGGMPGWQTTLIAAGAAVLAAILAVTADRARAARRHLAVPSL